MKCERCEVLVTPENMGWFIGSHCEGVMAGGHPDESMRVPDKYWCRACTQSPIISDDGVGLIATERQRQLNAEGWTPKHDDTHVNGEMAISAACYAVHHTDAKVIMGGQSKIEDAFPWGSCHDKRDKHSTLRALAIAGALIAAEIDRIQRRDAKK